MTHRQFIFHHPRLVIARVIAQVIAIALLLLGHTGCEKFTHIETYNQLENQEDQIESQISTRRVQVNSDPKKHSIQHLSITQIRPSMNYKATPNGNVGIVTPGNAGADSVPVEKFFTFLRLCVLSRECTDG